MCAGGFWLSELISLALGAAAFGVDPSYSRSVLVLLCSQFPFSLPLRAGGILDLGGSSSERLILG